VREWIPQSHSSCKDSHSFLRTSSDNVRLQGRQQGPCTRLFLECAPSSKVPCSRCLCLTHSDTGTAEAGYIWPYFGHGVTQQFSAGAQPPLPHLTSCSPAECNLLSLILMHLPALTVTSKDSSQCNFPTSCSFRTSKAFQRTPQICKPA
jgi:hypothetical protein